MLRRFGLPACLLMASLCVACSGGALLLKNPTDPKGGFAADAFLPPMQTGEAELALQGGKFDGAGNDLVFTDPVSSGSFKVADQTVFHSPDSIFDTDGDGKLDYIILTQRPLSGQAAASVSARDGSDNKVLGATFYKVGGVGIFPSDATI